ncbi:Caffeate O-methyltransferase (COMT) family [Cynara cardunculus var. scolymus]|uniref:Caffeate O-methyltransferase (COMT) family n=1 Tax=Cynara cardunculus var. scolymus TaxID=59895 RepID=A0A103Y817_CYNCS|nr:Caffeate O-methyltransferase (COMT) family [Cynara cardunculus var. scolymus]
MMMMKNTQNETDSYAILKGQTQILRYIYGVFDGMALRCCVELRIADIISNHGRPATLSEIASGINSPSINMDGLGRLMRFLVHKKVFDEMPKPEKGMGEGEKVYSLNYCSKWLLFDTNVTLAPMVMMRTDPSMVLPLHVLSRSIKEGGTTFKMTHGEEMFDFSQHNSEFNRIFNEGMACNAEITLDVIISKYKNGFLGLKGRVVDVGGGTGVAISTIVKTYPHLKGSTLICLMLFPLHQHTMGLPIGFCMIGVMKTVSRFLQTVEKRYLKNNSTEDDFFDDTRLTYDLVMFSHFSGGRERTESEWKKLLEEGGFCRYNIIKIPAMQSIIEAFP